MCKSEFANKIDKAIFPGLQGGPHEHTIAGKAVAFKEASTKEFREYSLQILKNAKVLAETLKSRKINLVSGGTDNHLILIDLSKTASINEIGMGKDIAIKLEEAGIVVNSNSVPGDKSSAMKPSGIRLGVPILTTVGMKEAEMKIVGNWIADVINHKSNEFIRRKIRSEVSDFALRFKFY